MFLRRTTRIAFPVRRREPPPAAACPRLSSSLSVPRRVAPGRRPPRCTATRRPQSRGRRRVEAHLPPKWPRRMCATPAPTSRRRPDTRSSRLLREARARASARRRSAAGGPYDPASPSTWSFAVRQKISSEKRFFHSVQLTWNIDQGPLARSPRTTTALSSTSIGQKAVRSSEASRGSGPNRA